MTMFQFHSGSIKSFPLFPNLPMLCGFQFHRGSIKSMATGIGFVGTLCFNSIVVRLKGALRAAWAEHYGGFNSIVVRLKVAKVVYISAAILSFNSIVVRLKASLSLSSCYGHEQFQFHSGSIKRAKRLMTFAFCGTVSIP